MAFNSKQHAYVTFRSILRERTSSVVAWVGSGVSADAGLPTWGALRQSLIDALRTSAATFKKQDREKKLAAADQAERQGNPWVAFQVLQDELGPTTFRDVIREKLSTSSRTKTPIAYTYLWKMGISGLLNLNLDRLATKAHNEFSPHALATEGNGFGVSNLVHALKSPTPFIINLHGIHEDVSTWVLTQKQLNSLSSQEGYRQFLASCLATRTVVFIGMTVDDVSVGGHLDRLATIAPDCGSHFWITHRRDAETDRWAEERQLRVIRYRATGNDHSELKELFQDLLSFQPVDDIPQPIVLAAEQEVLGKLLTPEELIRENPETIREALNSHAQKILVRDDDAAYRSFEEFCHTYDQAIYRAWYATTATGQNQLFQYVLKERVARGGFGTVYKAMDEKGHEVAVKVLNEEVRHDTHMLQGFRRGVRSMRILNKRQLQGMVPYLDATEIPAVVVMGWVEGPNLKQAVESHYVDQWKTRLEIASALAEIIRGAHSLPERVLHRDIRPANIMLKGYYADPDNFEVVVLDFDLSWHQGASERSVIYGATTTGYLAPEQLQSIHGVTTRHASVDSFGIGMTMFFLAAKRDPLPTEHAHTNWMSTVETVCNTLPYHGWVSLPARYARIILQCTKTRQGARWDMAQITGELARLIQAMEGPTEVRWADMLAEEIVAKSDYAGRYNWDDDVKAARVELPSGLGLTLCGDEANAVLKLKLYWNSTGGHSHKRVTKWLPEAGGRVEKALKNAGWEITGKLSWGEQVEFDAVVSVDKARTDLKKVIQAFNAACNELRFD
jgi:eukaryotic-like serine/threonine-protein kinase